MADSKTQNLNDENFHHKIGIHLDNVGQLMNKNITELDRQDVLNKNYIRQLNQIDQYIKSAIILMKEEHAVELKRSEEQTKRSEEQAKQRKAFIQQQLDSVEQHLQQSQTELNHATEILRTMRNIQTEKSE